MCINREELSKSSLVHSLHDFIPMFCIMVSRKFNQLGDTAALISPGIEQITRK
jgi:hypothetical protein